MSNRTKTKKFRGSARHGRGRKGGRGKGLRGGKGNAGLHKHKYASTVKMENAGILVFGKHGFKRPKNTVYADRTINVGDLEFRFPGKSTLDLGAEGFTKLLGAGDVTRALTVSVDAASEGAVEKVKAKGGNVQTTRVAKQTPAAKAAPKGAPAKK